MSLWKRYLRRYQATHTMSSYLEKPENESLGHSLRPPKTTLGGIKEAHPMSHKSAG